MLGVDVDMPEGWESEVEAIGVNLPTDLLQRKAIYLHYMVLSAADLQLLRTELQLLALGNVVSDDQMVSFRSGTRSALAREARARLGDALEALAGGSVVGGAEAERVDDGESLGADTEPVGQVGV
jgi:hypothetical protein